MNRFIGTENPDEKILKVTISSVPLSVDDEAVHEMLHKLGVRS